MSAERRARGAVGRVALQALRGLTWHRGAPDHRLSGAGVRPPAAHAASRPHAPCRCWKA